MNWRHLIQSALLLAGQLPARTPPGRPRQADLKRAISNAYYAMFHALCHSNATALWGNPGGTPGAPGWSRIYRSLEHNQARQRMNQITGSSPQLRNFASTFQALQNHRHQADYDPNSRYLRSGVLNLIGQADASIQDLLSTSQDERRTLAVATILRPR